MNVFPPCINWEEDVICEDTKYIFEDISMPIFFSKEYVIDDIPPHEIIVETLCCGILVMSSS